MSDPDAKALDYTEYFCRHLIGLCWYEAPVNDNGEFTRHPDFRCASAFLLQVFDTLCLITAGHVLTEYNKRKKKGLVGQQHASLGTQNFEHRNRLCVEGRWGWGLRRLNLARLSRRRIGLRQANRLGFFGEFAPQVGEPLVRVSLLVQLQEAFA